MASTGSPAAPSATASSRTSARSTAPSSTSTVRATSCFSSASAGALGAPGIRGQLFNGKKYAYHDIALYANIENAFQAVALNEHRKPFLEHFRPCFNGDHHDSMSSAYRLLGTVDRPLGTAKGGVETLHQAVLDRLKQTPDLPPPFPPDLETMFTGVPLEETTRIPRGRPC